jgi:hypothetical protein
MMGNITLKEFFPFQQRAEIEHCNDNEDNHAGQVRQRFLEIEVFHGKGLNFSLMNIQKMKKEDNSKITFFINAIIRKKFYINREKLLLTQFFV